MPIYMDVHIAAGIKALDVAQAHSLDLEHQAEFKCKCMTYWIDEERENVFCLIEAPSKEAVIELHGKAHGLLPNKVIEVNQELVSSFLGRIYDPESAVINEAGLKVFEDPSFRVIMQLRVQDALLLQHCLGMEEANRILEAYKNTTRKQLALHSGREVETGGNDFIISFSSATKAVSCALAIQQELHQAGINDLNLKISLNGGEPVEESNDLFGDAIQLGGYMCAIGENMQLVMTATVKDLVAKDHTLNKNKQLLMLTAQEEALLRSLFGKLEDNWQQAEFDMDDYCKGMAMSNSQLYRKTIQLTGMSPNILLKEFRLEKAKDLMRKKNYPIAQITFESGFTSPSYFTKCFKKKYGLLPMAYLEMLH